MVRQIAGSHGEMLIVVLVVAEIDPELILPRRNSDPENAITGTRSRNAVSRSIGQICRKSDSPAWRTLCFGNRTRGER